MSSDEPAADRTVVGRYRLRSELGRGGMGTVWLAEDTLLLRTVAVKEITLPPGIPAQERASLRERTMREARTAARLDHPDVVTVYDVVEQHDRAYIVMELVPAHTLADVVATDGPLAPERVAEIGLCVLGALDAAHRVGVVHRDVKPGNVLLRDDGRATLTDFGIATATGDPSITSTGVVLGSPSYMAPERARGQEPGPAADMWSLGATLYTAIEGRPPFDRGEALATLAAVVTDDPAPMASAPGPLADLVAALLVKDPSRRADSTRVRSVLQEVAGSTAGPTRTRRRRAAVPAEKAAQVPATAAGTADRVAVGQFADSPGPEQPPPATDHLERTAAFAEDNEPEHVPARATAASRRAPPVHAPARVPGRRRLLVAAILLAIFLAAALVAAAITRHRQAGRAQGAPSPPSPAHGGCVAACRMPATASLGR